MTAEPRDVEEIRSDLGDLAVVLGDLAGVCSTQSRIEARAIRNSIRTRLAADVEPLLARLAAADRENAEMRAAIAATAADVERYVADRLADARQENAELRGEVERLRESQFAVGQALVNEQLRSERAESQLAAAQAQLAEAVGALDDVRAMHPPKSVDRKLASLRHWLAALSAAPIRPKPPEGAMIPIVERDGTVVGWLKKGVTFDSENGWSEDPIIPVSEPPASDEPARCEHASTEAHQAIRCSKCGGNEWDLTRHPDCFGAECVTCRNGAMDIGWGVVYYTNCPGPAASGTPDGGQS